MNDKEKVLQKVKSLFALTESSNIDEARNAALAAVRLIKKYDLEISSGSGTSKPKRPGVYSVEDFFRDVVGRQGHVVSRQGTNRPSTDDFSRRTARTDGFIEADFIRSRYPANCRKCRGRISVGELIRWIPGVGSWHHYCASVDNSAPKSDK